jgi:hypothetical protein
MWCLLCLFLGFVLGWFVCALLAVGRGDDYPDFD